MDELSNISETGSNSSHGNFRHLSADYSGHEKHGAKPIHGVVRVLTMLLGVDVLLWITSSILTFYLFAHSGHRAIAAGAAVAALFFGRDGLKIYRQRKRFRQLMPDILS